MRNEIVGRGQRKEDRLWTQLLKLQSATSICRTVVRTLQKHIATISTALLFLILQYGTAFAQNDTARPVGKPHVDMAIGLRSNGKIYVVVVVLVIILTGLFFYLTRLDRKITRLEKGENS